MPVLVVDPSPLVRQVTQRTLRRAGYDVRTAANAREGLELASQEAPSLILVDAESEANSLCPRCQEVDNLRGVPVVLMGVDAEALTSDRMRTLGAKDALTKPFSPEALLAVTAHTLATPERPRAETKGPDDPDEARLLAARRIADRLAAVIEGALTGEASVGRRLSSRLVEDLEHELLFELCDDLSELVPGQHGVLSFSGRVDHLPPSDILQLLAHQRQTGVLEVCREGRVIRICLREGKLDLALATGVENDFRLGRFLREEGLIEEKDLAHFLRNRHGSKRLLGAHLVKLGYLTQEDLRTALVRQTSELVYEVLRWTQGYYRFQKFARRPEAAGAELGLPVSAVLMEGLRRVDEWRLIEEQVQSFDMVLDVDPGALSLDDREHLRHEERRVLDAIDGERTVRAIVESVGLPTFETCRVLFQLMTSGLVRPPRGPRGSGASPP